MTTVNVSTTKNTVTVNEGDSTIVTVCNSVGPQGPGFGFSPRWIVQKLMILLCTISKFWYI